MQEHSASLDLAAGRAAQMAGDGDLAGPPPGAQDDLPAAPPPAARAARPDEAGAFTVRDRRFWATDSEGDDGERGRSDKPSFVRELEDKLAAAQDRASAVLAQYQEAKAEFEAARARMRRDLSREVEAGKRGFLADLLDVVDNLDRALLAAGGQPAPDGAVAPAPQAGGLLEGVTMVHRLFLDKLSQLGVRRMACQGAPFDAQRHEALAAVPVADPAQEGRVQGVIREGYMLGEVPLRFAQVAVGRLAPPEQDGADR